MEKVKSEISKERVNKHISEYIEEIKKNDGKERGFDFMFLGALEVVANTGVATTTMLRRKLGIGYPSASQYLDMMENMGVISPAGGKSGRSVYITTADALEIVEKVNCELVKARTIIDFDGYAEDLKTKFGAENCYDLLFWDVLEMVAATREASATMIRRKFGVGYPRAAAYLDMMENMGAISGPNGITGRFVYITVEEVAELRKRFKDC